MTPRTPDRSTGDDGVVDEVRIDLPADLTAPRAARAAVRTTLGRWRLHPLVESVTLAVSELVGNAVVHGRPPVGLVLSRGRRSLRAGVHDRSPGIPGPGGSAALDDAESGRGLAIVSALADDSGVESVPQDGKIVYATFATPPGEAAPDPTGPSVPGAAEAPARTDATG